MRNEIKSFIITCALIVVPIAFIISTGIMERLSPLAIVVAIGLSVSLFTFVFMTINDDFKK